MNSGSLVVKATSIVDHWFESNPYVPLIKQDLCGSMGGRSVVSRDCWFESSHRTAIFKAGPENFTQLLSNSGLVLFLTSLENIMTEFKHGTVVECIIDAIFYKEALIKFVVTSPVLI